MAARGSSTFVGRTRELDELGRTLDSTEAGAGATVLVAGEAGIGKTSLAAELAARADARGPLRPLGSVQQLDPGAAGSQLRMFQDTLALLSEHATAADSKHATLAALERAVELVPAEPLSAERAYALGSLAGGMMLFRRHAEALQLAEQALDVARAVGAREAEVRAITVLGTVLARAGRPEAGLPNLRQAVRLAEEIDDRLGLERAYVNFTDTLTELGRPRESARLAQEGLEVMRRYGIYSTLLIANHIEALLVRQGAARPGGACSARPRAPGRRRAPRLARARSQAGERRSADRSRSLGDGTRCGRLAPARRGGVPPRPRRIPPAGVGASGSELGATRTAGPRCVLLAAAS